jgi:DNA-binding NtrC family response regulator
MKNCILIVDDQADVRMSAGFLFTNHGYTVLEADSPINAMAQLKKQAVDVVLLDMNFSLDTTSGAEGLAFLKQLQEQQVSAAVVVMTAWSSIDLAVEAMQNGAGDFIEKPWKNQRLLQIVKQQCKVNSLLRENHALKQQQSDQFESEQIIAQSPAMKQVMQQLQRLATTDATILLTGDNGTGKSSIARYIHQVSGRCDKPFVAVNMGAIPENLFESEMFGHTKGAFTDAKQQRVGRFELAQGGTLFLDEIANIPLSQQAKLLRILEDGDYEMVGSSVTKKTDIRLICATNADIQANIDSGAFRSDLYFRLNTLEIHIPALITRQQDIVVLAEYFLKRHAQRYARMSMSLGQDAVDKLNGYGWPGNVRELSHIIERAVLLAEQDRLGAEDIYYKNQRSEAPTDNSKIPIMPLEEAECTLIKAALVKTVGNIVEAATMLGISQSSLYRRMEKYDISKSDLRQN